MVVVNMLLIFDLCFESYTEIFVYFLNIAKRGRKRKLVPTVSETTKSKKEVESSTETENKSAETEMELAASGTDPKPTGEPSASTPTTAKEKPAKKAKKPLPEGFNSGVYTDLEEKNFLEGLEKYGRDWGEVRFTRNSYHSREKKKEKLTNYLCSFKDLWPQEIQIRSEVMLKSILSKCTEIKLPYQTKLENQVTVIHYQESH
jgi:hypothetical protein